MSIFDPRDLTEDPEEQRRLWHRHLRAESARNHCPYSGYTITGCKRIDLCDCFDFPEHDSPPRVPS